MRGVHKGFLVKKRRDVFFLEAGVGSWHAFGAPSARIDFPVIPHNTPEQRCLREFGRGCSTGQAGFGKTGMDNGRHGILAFFTDDAVLAGVKPAHADVETRAAKGQRNKFTGFFVAEITPYKPSQQIDPPEVE